MCVCGGGWKSLHNINMKCSIPSPEGSLPLAYHLDIAMKALDQTQKAEEMQTVAGGLESPMSTTERLVGKLKGIQ